MAIGPYQLYVLLQETTDYNFSQLGLKMKITLIIFLTCVTYLVETMDLKMAACINVCVATYFGI